MPKHAQSLLLTLTLLVATASTASATTLIDIGGVPDGATTVNPGEAIAISFLLSSEITGGELSIGGFCPTCSGTVWLNLDEIGPTATLGDTLASQPFNSGTPVAPLLTDLDLDPGVYYAIISIDSGFFSWNTISSPTVTTDPVATTSFDLFASPAALFAPQSNFGIKPGGRLEYTLTGTVVPEPSTALLVLTGLVGIALRKGRHS